MREIYAFCGICNEPTAFMRELDDDDIEGYCTECVMRAIKNEKARVRAATPDIKASLN